MTKKETLGNPLWLGTRERSVIFIPVLYLQKETVVARLFFLKTSQLECQLS